MTILNPSFLADIAKRHPALARALELSIYAFVGYVFGVLAGGDVWSLQAALSATAAPILAYINKRQRDLEKQSS